MDKEDETCSVMLLLHSRFSRENLISPNLTARSTEIRAQLMKSYVAELETERNTLLFIAL